VDIAETKDVPNPLQVGTRRQRPAKDNERRRAESCNCVADFDQRHLL
jgi:hypothetical protein